MKKQIFLFVMLFIFTAKAENDNELSCGENCLWSYDESTHTLTISGKGAMKDFGPNGAVGMNKLTYQAERPWHTIASEVENVIVSGVTSIGHRAFQDMGNLKNVTISEGVTSIGRSAFATSMEIESLTIPNSVDTIYGAAFDGFGGDIFCSKSKERICEQGLEDSNGLREDNILKFYDFDNGRYVLDNVRYLSIGDMQSKINGLGLKRIYTIDEANAVAGDKNRVSIKYR